MKKNFQHPWNWHPNASYLSSNLITFINIQYGRTMVLPPNPQRETPDVFLWSKKCNLFAYFTLLWRCIYRYQTRYWPTVMQLAINVMSRRTSLWNDANMRSVYLYVTLTLLVFYTADSECINTSLVPMLQKTLRLRWTDLPVNVVLVLFRSI